VGEGADSGAAWGGAGEPADPVEGLAEEPPAGSWLRPPEVFVLAAEAVGTVFPGKAWAATSASTAVTATLPAISQRLTRVSLRRAASRASGFVMSEVCAD
jgi:hypothetical protein